MKKVLILATMLIVAAAVGSAAPACTTVLGTDVTTLNAGGGCTMDGLLFNNFVVLKASGGTGLSEIDLVNATEVGGDVTLNFNPNLGLGTGGNTISDLHFAFTVSGPLFGSNLGTGGNNASISEQICGIISDINGQCLTANQLFNAVALAGQLDVCVGNVSSGTGTTSVCHFGAGVPEGWVFKNISVNDVSSSHLTSFNESFQTGVPEPMTLSMMGIGLLGLGLIARRRKK
jgi:hypothetical protein